MKSPINSIIQGDCLTELKKLPNDFVDTIITSPPYWGLRDYGVKGQLGLEKTLDEYLNKLLEITAELKRVLKKTGVMFWNHGDNYNSTKCGLTDQKKIDYLEKPEGDGLYNRKIKRYGKTQKNVANDIPLKCLVFQNYRLILKMIDKQGWILRNTVIWHKPNHMPSSVKDRFANSYEPVFMLVKNNEPQWYYNTQTGMNTDRPVAIKNGKEEIDWEYKRDNEGKLIIDKKTGEPQKRSFWQSVKYYFDLDAVRQPHKVVSLERLQRGVSDHHKYSEGAPGQIPHKGLNSPRPNTSKYAKGSEFEQKYGEPWDRFGKKTKKAQTKIPKSQAEKFGSPRWRYHREWKKQKKESYGNDDKGARRSRVRSWLNTKDRGTAQKILKERGMKATGIGPTGFDHNLLNNPKGKNPGDVWRITTQPFPEAHFATFPEKLIEPMILSSCPQWICKRCGKARTRVTKVDYKESEGKWGKQTRPKQKKTDDKKEGYRPQENLTKLVKTIGWTDCKCGAEFEGGIVLDPFIGSGTVAVVAKRLNRNYLGIELNKSYIGIAEKRIRSQPVPLL